MITEKLAEHIAFPKLLPRNHVFTNLVINSFHEKLIHGSVSHTLAVIRGEFWIPQGPTIKGIQAHKHELKICQYADDATVLVRDLDSVTSLLRVLNDFKEHSGPKINTTKTEAMRLGEWKDRTDEPFGFKWPKEPINALGVLFSYNQEIANRLNFGEKILNLEKSA